MTANINPETNLPYGVVSGNKLHPEVQDALYQKALDVVCKALRDERIAQWKKKIVEALGDLDGAASIEEDTQGVQEIAEYLTDEDYDSDYLPEEPCAEVEHDGIRVQVSYLGGAMLVTSLNGEVVSGESQCSPCVPNAINLDAGQWPPGDSNFDCHGFPIDWFDSEG